MFLGVFVLSKMVGVVLFATVARVEISNRSPSKRLRFSGDNRMSYCRGAVYMYYGPNGYTFHISESETFSTESAQEALEKMMALKRQGIPNLDNAITRLKQDIRTLKQSGGCVLDNDCGD